MAMTVTLGDLSDRRFSISDRLVTRSAKHDGIYRATVMIMTRRLARHQADASPGSQRANRSRGHWTNPAQRQRRGKTAEARQASGSAAARR